MTQSTMAIPAKRLFWAFLRLGATAFGGPAAVAYIQILAVKENQWLTKEEFQDGAALCQSIPGATAIQTAAYVGLRAGGPLGALAAFVGFGLPAFVLMAALSAAYVASRDLGPVLAAFRGLNVIVIAIIVNAAIRFGRGSIKNWRDAVVAAGAMVFLLFRGNPMIAIAGAASIGLVLHQNDNNPEAGRFSPQQTHIHRMLLWPTAFALLVFASLAVIFFADRKLFALATVMLKVDIFAFGGGFASVPLMLHEVVDVRHWMDGKIFMDGIALGQVTPGPIVITATFVGYHIAGLMGAVVGTLAVFSPSFFMVLTIAPFLDRLRESALFRRALRGVLASFVGLLAAVAFHFGMTIPWSIPATFMAVSAFVALYLKADILWVVLAGASIAVFAL